MEIFNVVKILLIETEFIALLLVENAFGKPFGVELLHK